MTILIEQGPFGGVPTDQRLHSQGYVSIGSPYGVAERYLVAGMDCTYALLGSTSALIAGGDSVELWIRRAFLSERSLFEEAELLADVLSVGIVRRPVTVRISTRRSLSADAGLSDDDWRAIARDSADDMV